MRSQRVRNVVVVLSLVAAALVLGYRRALPALVDFARYTDGRGLYEPGDPALRRAEWDEAQPLAGVAEGGARESNPALSPDGRSIVFAAGDAELGRDLYIADVAGDRAENVRALAGVSSAADDVSPSFADGRLYFASNRSGGAGGYDLYSCDWNGADFGEPQLVGGGVNTEFDEFDPARREGELCFASNRTHEGRSDFDLYLARDIVDANWQVSPLDALNTTSDEREPQFAAGGRAIYFASNREGTRGAFDLYRSYEDREGWLPPEPLTVLNSAASERSPSSSRDGFTIAFAREDAGDAGAEATPELWIAHSHELFRIPRGPRGWYDIVLASGLILVALLAFLSNRFQELDILWKCLLASLLVHAGFMVWSRYINPEGGGVESGGYGSDTIRVHLIPSEGMERSLSERSGVLDTSRTFSEELIEPERAEVSSVVVEGAPAPGPSMPMSAARSELADAPQAATQSIEPSIAAAPVVGPLLNAPSESFERVEAGAPHELGLGEVAGGAVTRSQSGAVGEPTEAAVAGVGERSVDAAPGTSSLVARREGPSEGDGPAPYVPSGIGPATGSAVSGGGGGAAGGGGGPVLEQPHENLVARSAAAPQEPSLSARSFGGDRGTGQGGGSGGVGRELERVEGTAPVLGASSAPSGPGGTGTIALHRQDVGSAADEQGVAPVATAPTRGTGAQRSGPNLAQPHEEIVRAAVSSPGSGGGSGGGGGGVAAPVATGGQRTNDAEAGAPGSRTEGLARADTGSGGGTGGGAAGPALTPLVAAPRDDDRALPAGPARLDDTPYRSRFGSEKEIALREHGGTAETERAVALGLRYLESRQHENGAWGDEGDRSNKYRDVRVGKTGLAFLAFLGAGHTQASNTQFSRVAENAIQFLLSMQDPSTGHFGDSEAYSHGVSTYALAECFALTRDERLREPLERAVQEILRHQLTRGGATRVGGWSYYYPDGATFDSYPRTSITAWQVMALESARLGGLSVPDATFDAAHQFLLAAWDADRGSFRYNHDPQRLNSSYATLPGSTPAGLFALSLLGEDVASPTWAPAVDFVTQRSPHGYRYTSDDDFVLRAQGNLYFWYYGSLALLRHGGPEWERWNAALKETLLPAQQRDGSWRPIDIYAQNYAGDDDEDRIYATAMCVLTLEVYYRYFTPLLRVR